MAPNLQAHKKKSSTGIILGIIGVIVFVIAFLMWAIPMYKVWQQGKLGEANLAKANQDRQIMIAQARAEVEAAELRAEAISVVGEMAQKFPEYRQQEFIGAFAEALREGNIDQIYYIPTEAGIPITEAGRVVHRTPGE